MGVLVYRFERQSDERYCKLNSLRSRFQAVADKQTVVAASFCLNAFVGFFILSHPGYKALYSLLYVMTLV